MGKANFYILFAIQKGLFFNCKMKLSSRGVLIKSLILLLTLFVLSACHNGWNQDPFADEPEDVRNPVPKTNEVPTQPPSQSVMFIDMETFWNSYEGNSITLPFTWRLTHPNSTFLRLEVENLEELFPGATLNVNEAEKSGDLSLVIPEGYVPGSLYVAQVPLTFSLYADIDGEVQIRKLTVAVNVLRTSVGQPVIERFENVPNSMIEGEKRAFQVFVRDNDSANGPVLSIRGTGNGFNSAAHLIDHFMSGQQVPGNPGLWKYEGLIDLDYNDVELTKSQLDLSALFIAYSAFGVPSNSKRMNFRVYSSASEPQFYFGSNRISFKKETANNYVFSVVDEKGEGSLSARFIDCTGDLGQGAQCSCQGSGPQLSCTVSWTPTVEGTHTVRLSAENKVNSGSNFEQTASSNQSFEIVVEP